MKSLNPYINFSGKCKEALNFYKECFGGEIVSIQTFADSPENVADDFKQNIMHSEFKSEEIYFMATDGTPGYEVSSGNNISLSINFIDEQEQQKVFNLLSRDGNVTMSLEDTFWGAKFGMLTDRYGINWMLNCSKLQSSEKSN